MSARDGLPPFPLQGRAVRGGGHRQARDLIAAARSLATDPDPGQAFFGFLGRFRQEAAAKRDLPDAIAIPGSLQGELHAALDVLLRRAQQAGAVRADVTTQDLTALLKGPLRTINDLPPGTGDEGRTDRPLTVVTDGLRRRDDQISGGKGRRHALVRNDRTTTRPTVPSRRS